MRTILNIKHVYTFKRNVNQNKFLYAILKNKIQQLIAFEVMHWICPKTGHLFKQRWCNGFKDFSVQKRKNWISPFDVFGQDSRWLHLQNILLFISLNVLFSVVNPIMQYEPPLSSFARVDWIKLMSFDGIASIIKWDNRANSSTIMFQSYKKKIFLWLGPVQIGRSFIWLTGLSLWFFRAESWERKKWFCNFIDILDLIIFLMSRFNCMESEQVLEHLCWWETELFEKYELF